MGFVVTDCISGESHYGDFSCAVCLQLPDLTEAVVTPCNHVFCRNCLNEWMRSQSQSHEDDLSEIQTCPCPSCKSIVRTAECRLLRDGNPLAFRLFSRIQVRCPLQGENCKWVGDYSEVQNHITNSSDHVGTPTEVNSAERTANAIKEQANEKFMSRNYKDAILLYNKAISVCPDTIPELYGNRAVTFFYLREYERCFADCKKAVQLNPKYSKALVRGARAAVELGEFADALQFLQDGAAAFREGSVPSVVAKEIEAIQSLLNEIEKGKQLSRDGKHGSARQVFSQLLQKTSAKQVMVLAAEEECLAGNTERALRLTLQVLRMDKSNTSALLTRAKAMYLNGDLQDSLTIIKEVLRLSPDERGAQSLFKMVKNLKAVYTKATKATSYSPNSGTCSYGEAVVIFSHLLGDNKARVLLAPEPAGKEPAAETWNENLETCQQVMESTPLPIVPSDSPLGIQLRAERANALFRLKRFSACLQDCAFAIYRQDDCKRAWLTKAYALLEMGKPQEALDELTPLVRDRWGQNDTVIRGVYDKAQFEVRKAARPDYYNLLGVSSLASEPEIKSGYKRKAMVYHPDRLGPEVSADDRKKAETTFKQMGEALEILTDNFKRSLYDEGYDKQAIDDRVQRAHKAAHHS